MVSSADTIRERFCRPQLLPSSRAAKGDRQVPSVTEWTGESCDAGPFPEQFVYGMKVLAES